MQKHEGNQATIYYLDMLGYIIVGIPLLLLLPASGIIQHPAVVCQAAVQCGVVELVLATRKTRCQGSPPVLAAAVRGASTSQGTVIMHIPDPGPAPPPAWARLHPAALSPASTQTQDTALHL